MNYIKLYIRQIYLKIYFSNHSSHQALFGTNFENQSYQKKVIDKPYVILLDQQDPNLNQILNFPTMTNFSNKKVTLCLQINNF